MVLAMFVPWFLLAAFGIDLPLIGMPSLDTSYDLTGAMQFFLLFSCISLGTLAWLEWTEIMPNVVFFYYHIPLIAAITLWDLQSSTTLIGKLFFSAPYLFTIWGGITVYAETSLPSAMV